MAESDVKPISALTTFGDILNDKSMFPIVVNIDDANRTRKVMFPALKQQIVGTEYTGILTAGQTSITFSSSADQYSASAAYTVGQRCTNDNKTYICVIACSAAAWTENYVNFVEYPAITTNSTVDIYTSVFGVNPTVVVVSSGSVALTFPSQSSDISVKVRVS